jgi:hypothetical protein
VKAQVDPKLRATYVEAVVIRSESERSAYTVSYDGPEGKLETEVDQDRVAVLRSDLMDQVAVLFFCCCHVYIRIPREACQGI